MRRVVTVVVLAAVAVTPAVAHAATGRSGPSAVYTGGQVGDINLRTLDSLVPAGDLRANGKQDVLDERTSGPQGQPRTIGVTARIGATGKAIWSHHYSVGSLESIVFLPARLGAKAASGVLVVDSADQSGGDMDSTTLTVTALAGSTGKALWSKSMTGSSVDGEASYVPYFNGLIVGGAPKTASMLLSFATSDSTESTETTELMSGVDGSVTSYGPSETTENSDGSAMYQVIPDTNRDGRSDVLLNVPGSGGFMRALSGTTGASIWTVNGLPAIEYPVVQPIGKLTSTTVPDLAVIGLDPSTNATVIAVVSGATGAVAWSRPADSFYLIGKGGHHRVPAIGLYTDRNTTTATSYASDLTYEAVSATNHVLYQHSLKVSVTLPPAPLTSSQYGGSAFSVGDVQPDGAGETGFDVEAAAADKHASHVDAHIGIVDGRTGVFHKVAAQVGSDASLHHGSGADLIAIGFSGDRPVLTAWDGTSRHRLYRRTLAVGRWLEEQVGGLRVSGHSCSDVSLSTQTSTRAGLGVVSGSGHPLWMVSFAHTAATGGTLKHFPKPKHFCA